MVVRSRERLRVLDRDLLPRMPAQGARPTRGGKVGSLGRDSSEETTRDEREAEELNMISMQAWFYWALFSAVFASLTAIFAKIGLEGVDSDFATLIRTVVILFAIMWFVYYTGKWSDPFALHRKTWVFLTLSGLATGASWLCYFRAL
jgi:drug/metabolite transporter (DMT)-like permease